MTLHNKYDAVIIGAGLSGLSCALELQKHKKKVLILESSDGPGGRVRTDEVDGFLLDRGFQVYLDSYPTAGSLFDLSKLNLKKFEPGALVYSDGKLHRVMDIFRRPKYLWASATAPIGNLFDKALVARLRMMLIKSSLTEIAEREDQTTKDYLRRFGFSERMIDGFFRSFYGGIFLERELRTSSKMFEFTFKMFTEGSACLPAKGMGELAKQLATRIPEGQIRYHCPVQKVSRNQIHLNSGETIEASSIVLATSHNAAKAIAPEIQIPHITWRSVTNLYFSSSKSPLNEPILALNGEKTGLVNNVAVLTDLCPDYAPSGQSLISVSLIGSHEQESLPDEVKEDLANWFGEEVSDWKHLRTILIPEALPEQLPDSACVADPKPPLYLCGDYRTSTSIEGAIISGQEAAKKILASNESL
ncbi:MAG: NAD(P)/FAD-dependent oxidoreductase [Roseibacillus sp.]